MAGFMVLLYSVFFWFGDCFYFINEDVKQEFMIYIYFEEYLEIVWYYGGKVKFILEDFWDYFVDFMDCLEDVKVQWEESDLVIYDLLDEDELRC